MTLSQWSKARVYKDFEASQQTYEVGLILKLLMSPSSWLEPSESRYIQLGFNHLSVQVCTVLYRGFSQKWIFFHSSGSPFLSKLL